MQVAIQRRRKVAQTTKIADKNLWMSKVKTKINYYVLYIKGYVMHGYGLINCGPL